MLSFASLLNWLTEADKPMNNEEHIGQVTTETARELPDKSGWITIAEACRIASEASEKTRQAQVAFAEEEAKRWYDYMVEE